MKSQPQIMRALALVTGLVCLAVLAGCRAASEPTTAPTTTVPPTQAVESRDSSAPAPLTPTHAPVLSADNCVACHTDQAKLEALAVDKTVKSEETEGEG